MQAVFVTGGKQYKVSEGDMVYVEKLDMEGSETIEFSEVLMVIDGESFTVGKPNVDGAVVTAKLVKNGKSKKILVFKYKAKKNYRRKQGHRQPYTKLQIEKITAQ